jgi:hypothetical protein
MGISAKELEVNTKHINELADQIRNNTDCEVLLLIVDEHLDSVRDLFADIKEEMRKLLTDILPVAGPPSPTPTSIVAWINKLITSLITPQLLAHIKYTKKLIQMAAAIYNVIDAIRVAKETLPQCAIEIKDQVLTEIENQIKGVVDEALGQIEESMTAVLGIADPSQTVLRIDTSSPEAFIQTVDKALPAIEQKVDDFKNAPLPA